MTKSKANAAIPNDDAAATPPTLPEAAEPTPFRPGSKLAALVARLVATGGATLEELMDATGWQAHSVRGALAGALRKRAGDINAARLHLEAHLGEASLVVLSGGITDEGQSRLHLYWRLTEVVSGPQLMQLCDLRGILARKVGGDTSFDSPHQPIRLAGSIYGKSGHRRLVQITNSSDQVYEFAQIDRAVQQMPPLDGLLAAAPVIATREKGPTAAELKQRRIRSEGRDDVTRFQAVGKVIGHWLHVARGGSMTMADAWTHVQEHNAACIEPPWDEAKLRESFDALLERDIASHGPMPELNDIADWAIHSESGFDAGADVGTASQGCLPDAVFLSDDDVASRFAERFRRGLRYGAARGSWMVWTGKVWKPDETRLALNQVRAICRVVASAVNDDKMARRICSERSINAVEKLARTDPCCKHSSRTENASVLCASTSWSSTRRAVPSTHTM